MSTLKDVWVKLKVDKVDRNGFTNFLQLLSITLNDDEINEVFTMLDIEKTGQLTYEDIRIFLKMTKVYDKTKYPKATVQRRGSYKIHPE